MPKTIVIQCAKRKHGGYLRATNGDKVRFVAEPQIVTPQSGWTSARLDDPAEFGATWRMVLSAYNDRFAQTGDNPDNLQPARQLYVGPAYRGFVRVFGVDNLYILSAGWGLVHACYLLPNYDITFSNPADQFSIRRKGMPFLDAKQMPDNVIGPVLFLGGLSYLRFFCKLTSGVRAERIAYYHSNKRPGAPGCRLIHYRSDNPRRWQMIWCHAVWSRIEQVKKVVKRADETDEFLAPASGVQHVTALHRRGEEAVQRCRRQRRLRRSLTDVIGNRSSFVWVVNVRWHGVAGPR